MQNLTVQKLCIGLVVLAFFIVSPWMTSELLGGNSMPFLVFAGTGLLLFFIFVLKDHCWMIIPFTLPIEGRLNFLPLNFSLQETAVIAVLAYVLIEIVMGRQIHWRLGPKWVWLPLSGLMVLLMYHWIVSGDIGIRAFGGTGWGGRKYFSILIGMISMPLLSSFPGITWKDFQRVPLVFFAGVFVDLIPDTLTTILPSTAPYIFRVYSAVNIAEFGKELVGNFGDTEGVTRYTTFRNLGQALVLVIISYFPFYTWLNINRLWILPVLMTSFFATAFSGFRSAMFNYAALFAAGLYATARAKALLLLPLAVGLALMIAGTQGNVFKYPRSIQRALSFLPGQWDVAVTKEGKGSNEWRGRIRELFFNEYFHKDPWIGTGFGFDPNLSKKTTELFLRIAGSAEQDDWADVRGFIEMKQPHEGDIHALIVSGVVGTGFFIAFCLACVIYSVRSVLRFSPKEMAPIQIWAFAILFQQSLAFFTVFGDYSITLPAMFPVIALLAASDKARPVWTHPSAGPENSLEEPTFRDPLKHAPDGGFSSESFHG
jgi:hypothetical protein